MRNRFEPVVDVDQKQARDVTLCIVECPSKPCRSAVLFANVALKLFACFLLTGLLIEPAKAQSEKGPERERFVPTDQLDVVFQRSPQGVMLQRDKFQELLEKAQQAEVEQAAIPTAVAIRKCQYAIEQADQHAIVELSIDIEQLADRWVALDIPVGNLLIENATIDETVANVGQSADKPDVLTLVHRQPGRFTLALKLSTPLASVGSDRIAAFRTVPAATSTVTVVCPQKRHLEVNNLQLTRPTPIDQAADYSFPAGGISEIRLKWTARQQQADTGSLVFAHTDAQLLLNASNIRWESTTRISVFGNTINRLVARIPNSLEITNVDSAGLEEWKLEDEPDENGFTRLLLNYRQPFSDDRIIRVSAISALNKQGSTKAPTLEFQGIMSHSGHLSVQHEEQLRLMASVSSGIRHVGTDLTAAKHLPSEVFDFWLQNYNLNVAVKPRDQELFAEINSTLSIVDTMATFRCNATVETLNAPLFELPLQLPDGWQLDDVLDAQDQPLKWREAAEKSKIVLEPTTAIAANQLLSFQVSLTRSISDPSSEQTLTLPLISAIDTQQVGGTYQISAADDLIVSPLEVFGLTPIGDASGTLLFETQGTAYSGKLSVVRKPARIATRAVIKSWMSTRQKTVDMTLTVDVVNGTTRTLQIQLPEQLGEEIRFEIVSIGKVPGFPLQQVPANLRIIEQSAKGVADGVRTFDVTVDRRFVGALTLRTQINATVESEHQLTAPFIRVVGAVRQHGLVSFEAYPDQQLTPLADDRFAHGLEPADSGLIDPPPPGSGRRTALVYRYIQPDYSLTVMENRYATEVVPSAVCEKVMNVSVLSETGRTQRSCCVHFQSSGVQTLRFSLPDTEHSYLWSTVLNGAAVEVRRDDHDFLVAIPTNRDGANHTLEILFESTATEMSVLGKLNQQSVSLAIDTERGKPASIDVLEQTWEVRYPSSAMLIDYDGGFQPQQKLELPGWLQKFSSLFYLPTRDSAVQRLLPVGLLAIILFVITTLILRRRWKSLVGFGAFGLLICFVFAGLLFRTIGRTASLHSTDSAIETFELHGGTNATFKADDRPAAATDFKMIPGSGGWDDKSATPTNEPTPFDRIAGAISGRDHNLRAPEQPTSRAKGATELSFGSVEFSDHVQSDTPFNQLKRPDTPRDEISGAMTGVTKPDAASSQGQEAARQSHRAETAAPNALPQLNLGQIQLDANGNSAVNFDADGIRFDIAPQEKAGAARLSIRANVASPADYQSMQFRSIDGAQKTSSLHLVVQKRSRMNALRIIAAAIVLLLCLVVRSASAITRFGLVIILTLTALAAVPLVPNSWQSSVDGVFLGTFAGIGLWMISSCCTWFAACWRNCLANGSCGLFRPKATSLTLLVAAVVAAGNQYSCAAPQDERSALTTTRPDVVLPYSPSQPELLADRVFLPKEEFLKLYQQAYPESLQQQAPAMDDVVAAFYKSGKREQVSDGRWTQSFTVRYMIRTYRDDANVRLPIGNVAIQSARLDEVTAILQSQIETAIPFAQQSPNSPVEQAEAVPQRFQQQQAEQKTAVPAGTYSVHIPKSGLHLLDVAFDVPATIEGPVGRLDVPLGRVATGTLSFELPDDKLEALINGHSNAFRTQGNVMTIPISKADNTRIEWRPKNTQSSSNTIYHVNVNSALLINDTGLTSKSSAEIRVRQGELSEITVSLPNDYVVQKVDGENIVSWNVPENDQATLKVQFQHPVTDLAHLNLTLFERKVFSTEEQTIDVPTITVQGASRDSGNATVIAGRELEVRVNSLSGVSQLNAAESELPAGIDNGERRILAWRYTRNPVSISVRVFRTADRLLVTSLNGVQLEPQRQLWTTLLKATISGAPRRRLEVNVPADFLALDISGNDLDDWYYTDNDDAATGNRVLNLQFTQAKTGTVNVVIQGQCGGTGDANQATLNPLQVVNADDASKTELSIWLDAASTIRRYSADGWTKNNGNPSVLQLKPTPPGISFLATGNLLNPINLTLDEAAAALVSESVSVSNVTDTSVELTLGLNWEISGNAAIRILSFSLPEVLAEVYDFHIPGLRQLKKVKEDDRVNFTIHLQQPVASRFFVLGTGTLPLPESKQISAQPPQFRVDESSKSSITSQSHFWVIVNQSSGLLEAVDQQTDGDNISEDDIKINIPAGLLQQSVAIRRLKSDRPNSAWQLKFPKRQQVTPAVVALAAHTTVIGGDGTWRSKHELQVRNESRQFLPVFIPQNSRFLYCLVQRQPVRVVSRNQNDRTLHLIPIPQSGELAAPFDVEFALSGNLPPALTEKTSWKVAIPGPVFPEYRVDPEFGITVSRNTWSVYTPEDWRADLVKDPRQTNVIPASSEDFEDAAVLSNVDNLISMINSLSLNSSKSPRDSNLYSSLAKQKTVLQNQRGNTKLAEDKRTQTLQELEEVLSEVNDSYSYSGQPAGVNRYLESNEAIQNDFNNVNISGFITSNELTQLDATALDNSSVQKFNFALPESIEPEAGKALFKSPQQSKPSGNADLKNQSESEALQQSAPARSQLLERRETNRKSQVDKAKKQSGAVQDLQSEVGDRMANSEQQQSASKREEMADSFGRRQQSSGVNANWAFDPIAGESAPADNGQLSLSFQIPVAGNRHDFVRTGGNAELTLGVRSQESIEWVLSAAWAMLCGIVALLLLRSSTKGSRSILRNVITLITLASLAGWLCLPIPLRLLSLLICIASVVLTCLSLVVGSFRKPSRA